MTQTNLFTKESLSLEEKMLTILADELDPLNTSNDYEVFKKKYFNDLAGFAKDCIVWDEGERLTEYQEKAMQEFVVRRRYSIRGPHGLGKTMLASVVILWYALTRDGTDWKLPTLASAWRQLTKYLWPEIHKWQRKLRWDLIGREPFKTGKELLNYSLKLGTGEAFAIASDNPAHIEGAHAKYMLYLFDESKVIPDETWDAAEGAFSSGDCMWLAISTPGEQSGRFYDIHSHKSGFEDWGTMFVTLDMAIKAKRINPDWAKQRAKQWGETSAVYKNRVKGEFASSDDDGVISLADIERSNIRWLDKNDNGEWKELTGIGVDIGRGGDPSVIAKEYDGRAIKELERIQTRDSMEIAGRVVGILRKWVEAVAVIDLGYDPGVYDRVREDPKARRGAKPFIASAKTDLTDETGELGFMNERSAAWWNLREMLKNDEYDLPPDDKLTGDLTAPHYKLMSGGKIAVEGKGETKAFGAGVKKKLGRSTDDGDAVVQVAYKNNMRSDEDDWEGFDTIEDFKSKWK